MRFIEQLGLIILDLILAGAAIGCLSAAKGDGGGMYAIAAGLFALAFVHLLVSGGHQQKRS